MLSSSDVVQVQHFVRKQILVLPLICYTLTGFLFVAGVLGFLYGMTVLEPGWNPATVVAAISLASAATVSLLQPAFLRWNYRILQKRALVLLQKAFPEAAVDDSWGSEGLDWFLSMSPGKQGIGYRIDSTLDSSGAVWVLEGVRKGNKQQLRIIKEAD